MTNPNRWTVVLFIWLASASASLAQSTAVGADAIQEQVQALAEPANIESRRAAIVARLEGMGLEPRLAWFDPPPRVSRRGANIVAEIAGSSSDVLLLGAHYDHVGLAQGVIDNAAGVAVVLQLAEALTREKLSHFTVRIALFDLEEDGLLGARAMVRDSVRTPLPHTFLNFDVFGYGESFWMGALDDGASLPAALREAGTDSGMEVVIDSLYPPSDHLAFRGTRTASYSLSLLASEELHDVLTRFRARNMNAGGPPPRVFQILHTAEDTLDKLDSAAVARGVEVVEQAIRKFDAVARE
jgi:aminopeptidase S